MNYELEETKFRNQQLEKENQRLISKLKNLEYLYYIQFLRPEYKNEFQLVEYIPEFITESLLSTQPPVLKRSTNNLFKGQEKTILFDNMDDLYLEPIVDMEREAFIESIQKLIEERNRRESIDDTALFKLKRL
jgi:hypothetical protein